MKNRLIYNIPKNEFRETLQKVDLVCVDLDECLFPFFTQVFVVAEILLESFFKKNQWKYIPRLLIGALFVLLFFIVTFGQIKIAGNKFLMRAFEWTVRGIPLAVIKKHSQQLHTSLCEDSLNFLEVLSRKGAKVMLLSLSIQPIIDTLTDNIGFMEKGIGNEMIIDAASGEIRSYSDMIMCGPEGKEEAFKNIVEEYKPHCPLIIGHSCDEIPLVERAKALGGLSIGINPKKKQRDKFDLILKTTTWKPLVDMLEINKNEY